MAVNNDLWERRYTIDKERREKMAEAMKDYDSTIYHPARKQLYEECGAIGHHWRFIDTNPIGYPIYTCTICGMTEIKSDK